MANLKALASPKTLKVPRKEKVWILKAAPGPYAQSASVPIGLLIRDYFGLAQNKKEVRYVLHNNEVLVNGRRVNDEKLPVGLFDIVSIPLVDKHFIINVDHLGRMSPKEIKKSETASKLYRLAGKRVLKGGKVQLNLYGGVNILADAKEAKKYAVGGTLVVTLADGKITDYIERAPGKIGYVTKGRHSGKAGKILEITKSGLNLKSLTKVETDGGEFITDTGYIFIVGDKKALV